MTYNVFVFEPYEGYAHVLADCDEQELRNFLSRYKGYLDDLTIIEGKISNTDTLIGQLGFQRFWGKIKK